MIDDNRLLEHLEHYIHESEVVPEDASEYLKSFLEGASYAYNSVKILVDVMKESKH